MQVIGDPPPQDSGGGEKRSYFYLAHVDGGDVIEVRLKGDMKNDKHAYACALNHYTNNLLRLYGQYELLDLCRVIDRDGKETSVLIRRSTPKPEQKVRSSDLRKAVSDLLRNDSQPQEKVLGPAPAAPPAPKTELPYKLGVW